MKKVIILTAAVAAFSFVTPQVSNAMKFQTPIAVVGEDDDKYKEIKAEELPEAVTKSVSTAYTGYKIDKAYRGEDDSYKVKVAMGDLKYSLFYDEKGELIKVEDPSAKTSEDVLNKSGMDTTKLDKTWDNTKSTVEPLNRGTSSVPSTTEEKSNQGTGTETR
ncbi:MAG: PepSY-like domain-containing protein [Verrucomicrobia bacterium]|nr:PepSY-like domain-containing protein [Prolixibacteraceae bacterium]